MRFARVERDLLWYAVVALMLLALTVGLPPTGCQSAQVTPADKAAYFHALADSQNATQRKVNRNLLAIVPGADRVNAKRLSGSEIRWEGVPGHSRVLVVAFMDRKTFQNYYLDNRKSKSKSYTLSKSLWVTVVPELKNFFVNKHGESCPPDSRRIIKLLGLNPASDYDVLLELWVDPQTLFRPSADPEVTDHEAELAEKVTDDFWFFPVDRNPFLKFSSNQFVDRKGLNPVSFKRWYTDLVKSSYTIQDPEAPNTWGSPWTRLGYTYDWGNPKGHVGLSEFVIWVDPEQNGGEVTVTLNRAIRCKTPGACGDTWSQYFRCTPEAGSAIGDERPSLPDPFPTD
jgi:hypothetical protein